MYYRNTSNNIDAILGRFTSHRKENEVKVKENTNIIKFVVVI